MTNEDDTPVSDGFAALGLRAELLAALEAAGHKRPSDIQSRAIPPLLAGRDALIASRTGTGKTAAFVLPMLQKLASGEAGTPRALILEPTRELAAQTAAVCRALGRRLPLRTRLVTGGVSREQQLRALSGGADILVATHGRLLDLVSRSEITLDRLTFLVFDEADRLLDEDFAESMDALALHFPDPPPQTVFCSATLPESVMALARKVTRDPVRIEEEAKSAMPAALRQRAIFAEEEDKPALAARITGAEKGRRIVFVRTKKGAESLASFLRRAGLAASALHGDMPQGARAKALDAFRAKGGILVTTDLAARGLDIPEVALVLNMDLPDTPETYIHRIGRTARAGRGGVAWSLVGPAERASLRRIEQATGQRIRILTPDSL